MTTASDALTRALVTLAADGYRPACGTDLGRAWISDDPTDRAIAARACHGCPLTNLCAAAGAGEVWGVWGGVDRAPNRASREAVTG